ncbi:mitochondrial genome maintenance exonuclease 1-like [Centruroides vittatus]|uniref:mitochondrial genome maintenance exonuclease 1-like n=1 Tax=Centruroides vittatus TaxID=120091 RepID=UPI00350EB08B
MHIRQQFYKSVVFTIQRFNSSKVKETVNHKSFSNGSQTVLNSIKSAPVVKRINWENINLFGPLLKRRAHKKSLIKHVPDSLSSNNENSSNFSFIEEKKCLLYFENLKAEDFVHGYKYILPSSNFNITYALDFPLLNIDSNDKYEGIPYLSELKNYNLPSVTTVLNQTMSPTNMAILQKWKAKMILELGEEGFKKYQRDTFENGSSLHRCIENYLLGIPESELIIKAENLGHWKSLKTVIPYICNVKLLEKPVKHPYLLYKGIIDCVATYRDHLVVIDWKTSKRHKRTLSSTYDNPLQLAAYVGAINFDTAHDLKVDSAALIIAYENGDPAEVHYMPSALCNVYWKEWLKRLRQYWNIINTKEISL